MTAAAAKRNAGTVLIAVVLGVALLIGSALFGYYGYRLLTARPAPQQQAVATAKPTSTVTPSPMPTATRTPTVILAPTTIPYTPGPMGDESPATTATPSPTPGGNKLPQTGIGLGAPLFGLILAGLASGARWIRRRG